ncbi:MAG: acetate--CoA ligase family protein [Alphaproteobacteria bacterium]|nr:acetate--CoA ligase family protein [Alphaproteobacteria bacterium]
MNFEEHAAKPLLARYNIAVPKSRLAHTPAEAEDAARQIGPCVVKAQVPTGKRGKAGGIKLAGTPGEARQHAEAIIGMTIADWPVEKVLVEAQTAIAKELYLAILNDSATKGPMLLFSAMGGMDVEEVAEKDPTAMRHFAIPISEGPTLAMAQEAIAGLGLEAAGDELTATILNLYRAYRELDAELIEINPLVVTTEDHVVALDCKLTLDDSAAARQEAVAAQAAPERTTDLEAKAAAAGLKYIELGGSVGVLANGAGLTMTTMDVIAHYGGKPANFLEIGGEAYTKAKTALSILLENPNVKSLLVNFCGAFARTDVMAEGVVNAWEELQPDIPVFFTIHGTGEEEAIALVKERLGIEPYDLMDDAVKAAVAAANTRSAA